MSDWKDDFREHATQRRTTQHGLAAKYAAELQRMSSDRRNFLLGLDADGADAEIQRLQKEIELLKRQADNYELSNRIFNEMKDEREKEIAFLREV